MMVDDRSALDWWGDWGDWQDWEDEHTSPLGFEELPPHRDRRSLIHFSAAESPAGSMRQVRTRPIFSV